MQFTKKVFFNASNKIFVCDGNSSNSREISQKSFIIEFINHICGEGFLNWPANASNLNYHENAAIWMIISILLI